MNDAEVIVQLEERFFAPARARLGEAAWNEARKAASAMSADDAIAFALDR